MRPRREENPDPTDRVYRALGHGGRRALLTHLRREGGQTLTELTDKFSMTRQAVSQHLEQLEEAELVVTRRHGRHKLHYLNAAPLAAAFEGWMAELLTPAGHALAELGRALDDRVPSDATEVGPDDGRGAA